MIVGIIDAKEHLINYFGDEKELKKATEEEVNKAINRLAKESCDFLIADLLKWLAEKEDNYFAVEEAIEKAGGLGKNGIDLIDAIRNGQMIMAKWFLEKAKEELRG